MKPAFNSKAAQDPAQTTLREDLYIRCEAALMHGQLQDDPDAHVGLYKGTTFYPFHETDTETDIAIRMYEFAQVPLRLAATGLAQDFLFAERTDSNDIDIYRLTLDAIRLSREVKKDIIFMFGDVQLQVSPTSQAQDIEELFPEKSRIIPASASAQPSKYAEFEGDLPSPGTFMIRPEKKTLQ